MPRGRPKSDPFAALDQEWKDLINNMKEDEIRNRVAEIALERETLLKAKKEDMDLKEKAIAYAEAGRVYKEGVKGAQVRIQYAQMVLESRGKA